MEFHTFLMIPDDKKIYMEIRNSEDRKLLQHQINELCQWSKRNGLTLNPAKTYHMSYGKKIIHSVYFQNIEIKKVSTKRDLGITFDDKLPFKAHTHNKSQPFFKKI